WSIARILPFISFIAFEVTAAVETLFFILLLFFAIKPVLQVKQVKQGGIILVLLLLLISNSIFYLGVFNVIENGVHIGLYSGLYLILLLIFIMSRRVIPFFIEKGVDDAIKIHNFKWLDISVIILFLLYAVLDIYSIYFGSLMIISGLLLLLHSVRMIAWYSNGIWKKPLLWSIYLAYGFIVLGFALKLMISYYGFHPFLEIHSFTVGGIGLLTLGMMSRVALGHTGRNVFEPPRSIFWIVLIFTIATFCRVLLPIIFPNLYLLSILLSQIFWIAAFVLFLIIYFPILIQVRIDGRPG
ncbi:MAG: NnrS family protein, partial [Thiohalomonadales bacterium]